MAPEREDSEQPELWPSEMTASEERTRESSSSSGRTRARTNLQRRVRRPKEPAQTPDPAPTAVPATANNDSSHMWSIDEVAHFLNVSKDTIYGWRKNGYGPPASKIGKHLRWRPQDVSEWVERLRQAEPAATD
jgi:excisionase family DNA binding protein